MYKTSDLYIAAFLKALGHNCKFENTGKKILFIFDSEVQEKADEYVSLSDRNSHNVNASALVDEVKKLKTYVNSL